MKIKAHHNFKHKMMELKARVGDHEFLRKKMSALGAEYVGTFQQTDLYFKVPEGRLKLREIKDSSTAELIYYEREKIAGPKNDDAFILRVQESEDLKKILKKILTPLVDIKKVREIYRYQGTQIHLDTVKKLGTFIEFEIESSEQTEKRNIEFLRDLMSKLDITEKQLVKVSYSDLLLSTS